MREIQSWEATTPVEFANIIAPDARPAVLRAIVADWPLVAAARLGADRCIAMLAEQATDTPIEVLRTDPANDGRFHYTPDGRALNFVRGRTTLPIFLAALKEQATNTRPFAMAALGVVAERVLPTFGSSHPMPYVQSPATPRFWIGNAAKVATHNDPSDNTAVVVAGRRRFTLFPPDQIANLYLGPLHVTPAGTPVSMVHLTAPDFDLYPRFVAALEAAEVAELEPGNAIFIPYGWVPSRRGPRALQHAGQLLVEPRARRRRIAVGCNAARHAQPKATARQPANGMAGDVRSLCVPGRGRPGCAHTRRDGRNPRASNGGNYCADAQGASRSAQHVSPQMITGKPEVSAPSPPGPFANVPPMAPS